MYFIFPILGVGVLFVTIISIVDGNFLSAAVSIAAFVTFLAIGKWKKLLPPEIWNQSRFKYGRIVKLVIGLGLFAMAMLQLGMIARTVWANYFGEESSSVDIGDIFIDVFMTVFALALVGYVKIAGILFLEFFFSMVLGGSLDSFFDPRNHLNALPSSCTYALAFLVVFVLGQWFHWSKGFALAGMLLVFCAYLTAYITM